MTTNTSTDAYHSAIQSGLISNNQALVLRIMNESSQPLTAGEIARAAGKDKSTITPRLRDLELMNVIKKGLPRKCSVTGHRASPYSFTGMQARKLQRSSEKCPLCHGAGKVPVA